MWIFNLNSSLWTWIGGNITANDLGSDTWPGARAYARSWKDSKGNFYFLGGTNSFSGNNRHFF
jgi:hypothetical protein